MSNDDGAGEGFTMCPACGGNGTGADRIDGPGDVYQDACSRCDGEGRLPLAGQMPGPDPHLVTVTIADALDARGWTQQAAFVRDVFCRVTAGPDKARLDADGTAKPLTEIVGVFPVGKKAFYDNAESLIVRRAADSSGAALDVAVREFLSATHKPDDPESWNEPARMALVNALQHAASSSGETLHDVLAKIAEKAAAVGPHGTPAQRRACLLSIENYARAALVRAGPAANQSSLTDASLIEWAASWVPDAPPGQRERFATALREEMVRRSAAFGTAALFTPAAQEEKKT